jgi:hypothetical protein
MGYIRGGRIDVFGGGFYRVTGINIEIGKKSVFNN